jgi:hypothetical protein
MLLVLGGVFIARGSRRRETGPSSM